MHPCIHPYVSTSYVTALGETTIVGSWLSGLSGLGMCETFRAGGSTVAMSMASPRNCEDHPGAHWPLRVDAVFAAWMPGFPAMPGEASKTILWTWFEHVWTIRPRSEPRQTAMGIQHLTIFLNIHEHILGYLSTTGGSSICKTCCRVHFAWFLPCQWWI